MSQVLWRHWLSQPAFDGHHGEKVQLPSCRPVAVFTAGEYEDLIAKNSTWSEGDWNGDGDFTSTDLVVAFQSGGYLQAVVPTVIAADVIAAISSADQRKRRDATDSIMTDLDDEPWLFDEDVLQSVA